MAKTKWAFDVNHVRKLGAFELCVWPDYPPYSAWLRLPATQEPFVLARMNGYKSLDDAKAGIESHFREFLVKHLAELAVPGEIIEIEGGN